MFGVHDLVGDEVVVETEVASKNVNLSIDEVTLAQALAALKSAKLKADKVMLQEPEHGTITTTTAATTVTAASIRPKAKGLVIHEEGQVTTPKVSSQQPSQLNVQDKGKGKMVEPEKPMKKKELIRLDEEIASKLQAEFNEELAQRLQAQVQEELTDEENARLFVQFLEQRRKHFAAKRAEEKRNRPPTRAQQRSIMVNTFVDYRTDSVEESSKKAKAEIAQESSSKRAGYELEQENAKKQKVDEDKETTELQSLIEVVLDDEEEVAIDVVPLATKPPTIVDWKIHKEGKKNSGGFRFDSMGRFKDNRRNQQNYSVLDWKLYDSCGVYSLRKQNVYIHMLVEKRYSLTPSTITDMLNKKLQGRIVGIKRLLDDLRVIAVKLMLLVYKLLLLVLKVNAASTKVTTAQRLRLLKDFLLSENDIRQRKG
ncbi:hypothetical protein Tco_1275353 [Tanacetum coccineum]